MFTLKLLTTGIHANMDGNWLTAISSLWFEGEQLPSEMYYDDKHDTNDYDSDSNSDKSDNIDYKEDIGDNMNDDLFRV